nr:hypothetical protein BaRGS_022421 [Batillaria attramentaria]
MYSTTVSSTLSTGSQVFEVLTNDSESDSLTFTLTCVNSASCPFSIYSSGVILLTSSLVDTTDLAYELDITVTDGYHATAAHRLTVFVSGLNTPPVLTNLPSTVNVAEDAASGTNIFTISIYDDDGDTSFTISDTYTPTSGATVFAINSISQ